MKYRIEIVLKRGPKFGFRIKNNYDISVYDSTSTYENPDQAWGVAQQYLTRIVENEAKCIPTR